MQQATNPIEKDLVLIGGGHTHAIALLMYGMKPLPGVRLTLITDTSHTPYSGMLPGHVAGYYDFDQCHIDLRRLAQFAKAQLYIDRAVGLDLANQKVNCANHPPVAFDVLAIDIGSTPASIDVPGAAEYAIAAKPVPEFLNQWNQLIQDVINYPEKPRCLSIVGGGAGGVELALTMQRRLHQILKAAQVELNLIEIHLFHRGTKLMPGHSTWTSQRLQGILIQRGIKMHLGETVAEVLPQKILCESGLAVECERVFWVTQASAPSWIAESGLKTDQDGFLLVRDTLQTLSHDQIFAAGDIATMVNYVRPKAGVFAVRQGKPLFENLQRIFLKKPLIDYKPQQFYLGLIGTGNGEAIASWGAFGWKSGLLWRWKDNIDRKFMQRFRDLPMSAMTPQTQGEVKQEAENKMHCAGCGSKVGSSTLEKVLQRLQFAYPLTQREDILVGLGTPDDAAVMQVPTGQLMVQTIDYFRSLINDPYIFAQISTNHCLSDIFAMGATPHSALAVVTVPYGSEAKVEETLFQLLSGAMKALAEAQSPLIGGHTTEGTELAFGLTCNGLATPGKLLKKSGMKPGDVLILSKALGTGVLFAADMRLKAKGRWIDNAVASMLLSNQQAVRALVEHGVTACTDVTGFGLLGHLKEMVQASEVGVELNLEAIRVLEGVREMLELGIVSSLQPQNLRASAWISNLSEVENYHDFPILFDPQTSGGLLASVPAHRASNCLSLLKDLGYVDAAIIGRVVSEVAGTKPIKITTS
jgi:selenide, water dikinase